MMLSREAIILNYTVGAAWKFRDVFGVGATLQAISVPRLDYSLMVDGTAMQQTVNPVQSPLDMVASTSGSDWFTFNAIVGALGPAGPVPAIRRGGAGGAQQHHDQQHAAGDAARPDSGAGRPDARGHPANDVSVTLPLPLFARVGARYRGPGGREVFDIELDVEYETWSRVQRFRVDTNGLIASFGRRRRCRCRPHRHREALARHGAGERWAVTSPSSRTGSRPPCRASASGCRCPTAADLGPVARFDAVGVDPEPLYPRPGFVGHVQLDVEALAPVGARWRYGRRRAPAAAAATSRARRWRARRRA